MHVQGQSCREFVQCTWPVLFDEWVYRMLQKFPKLLKGWKMVLYQGGTGESLGGTIDVWYRISSNFLSRQDSQKQRLIGS